MVTVSSLYKGASDPEHTTPFVLSTTFLEPLICKYWYTKDKALLNPKWNTAYPFISFEKGRIKVSRLLPLTREATDGIVSVDRVHFDYSNCVLVGIGKDGFSIS